MNDQKRNPDDAAATKQEEERTPREPQEQSAGVADAGGSQAPAEDETAAHDETSAADEPPRIIKPRRRTVLIMMGVALLAILMILYAWQLWPFTSAVETTENAYVRGQITVMAPQLNGYVDEVLVQDFDHVEAGQPLVRIDERIFRQRVEQARADLANQRAQLANAEQTINQNRATIASRKAELASLEAELDRAQADMARVEELARDGSVSLRERDQTRATLRSAQAQVAQGKASVNIAEQDLRATEVSREGLKAQVEYAQAALRLAEIDLDNTVIRAPREGQLSQVSVREGQYVSAGTQLLYLVPNQLWIVANYKEAQTQYMRVGQPVEFSVDALGGATLKGIIEQLSPATGSEFSVLQSDNATGNFTKVAQRIPVRVTIDLDQPLANRLRPGMSVITRVDTSPARDANTNEEIR